LSNWWGKTHRGRVYGWYVFAAGMSSVLTFVMAATVVGFGWRWIFRLPVILMLVGCVVFWLVIREKPANAGFKELEDEDDAERARAGDDDLKWWQRYVAGFKCWPFLCGCGAIGFQNLARYGLLVWVPVHFLGENWKDPDSPQKWIAVALPVGMAMGAVTAGWVSDRLFRGRRAAPVIWFLLLASVFSGSMYFIGHTSVLSMPLLFLAGFFVYGPQSALWALGPDLLGKRLAGTGTGMMNFFAYLLAGLGEPLIGTLIENTGSTHMVFPVVATSCVVGATLMSFARKK
ncbi:MAG: MFS transporter, partial [Verrucomicrobiaceae bacterium]